MSDDSGLKQAWRTLRWASVALFMVLLDGTILFVAFPSVRRSFPSVLASDLSWILTALLSAPIDTQSAQSQMDVFIDAPRVSANAKTSNNATGAAR